MTENNRSFTPEQVETIQEFQKKAAPAWLSSTARALNPFHWLGRAGRGAADATVGRSLSKSISRVGPTGQPIHFPFQVKARGLGIDQGKLQAALDDTVAKATPQIEKQLALLNRGVQRQKGINPGVGARLGEFASAHPLGAAGLAAGGAFGVSRLMNNSGGGRAPTFNVYKAGMEKAALGNLAKGLIGGAAGGAALGGGLGHLATRRHYEPFSVGIANPQTGEYMGDVVGPRDAVEDWQDQMSEADDYNDIQTATEEAAERGVMFQTKMSSASEDQRSPGQMMAHAFLGEMSKIAAQKAAELYEDGLISKSTHDVFRQGSYDLAKIGRLIVASATANAAE